MAAANLLWWIARLGDELASWVDDMAHMTLLLEERTKWYSANREALDYAGMAASSAGVHHSTRLPPDDRPVTDLV